MILLDLSSFFLFTALSTFIYYYKALKHSPASTFQFKFKYHVIAFFVFL